MNTCHPRTRLAQAALVCALIMMTLTGCMSGPPLNALPTAPTDLSGSWCLVRAGLDEALAASERERDEDLLSRRPTDRVRGALDLPLQMRIERLRIVQGASYTRLNYGDLLVREYNWGENQNSTSVQVGWLDGWLVVRTQLGRSERLIERYRLDQPAGRLIQDAEYVGPGGNRSFARTFEPVSNDVTWCQLAT